MANPPEADSSSANPQRPVDSASPPRSTNAWKSRCLEVPLQMHVAQRPSFGRKPAVHRPPVGSDDPGELLPEQRRPPRAAAAAINHKGCQPWPHCPLQPGLLLPLAPAGFIHIDHRCLLHGRQPPAKGAQGEPRPAGQRGSTARRQGSGALPSGTRSPVRLRRTGGSNSVTWWRQRRLGRRALVPGNGSWQRRQRSGATTTTASTYSVGSRGRKWPRCPGCPPRLRPVGDAGRLCVACGGPDDGGREESCPRRLSSSRRCSCNAATSTCKPRMSIWASAGSASQRFGGSGAAAASTATILRRYGGPASALSRRQGVVNAYL